MIVVISFATLTPAIAAYENPVNVTKVRVIEPTGNSEAAWVSTWTCVVPPTKAQVL